MNHRTGRHSARCNAPHLRVVGSGEDPAAWPPPPPNVTPEFVELLELAAAERGLPPEPWPLPSGDWPA